MSGVAFAGTNLNTMYLTAAKIIVNGYGGQILQNRTQDTSFLTLSGLDAQGYGYPRVCLEQGYECST